MFKRCPDCEETKPYSDYYKSNTTKTGIQVYCKSCCNAQDRAKRDRYRAFGPTIQRDSKECNKCHNIKPISQFGVKRDSADGHLSYCKPCWLNITKLAQAKQRKK